MKLHPLLLAIIILISNPKQMFDRGGEGERYCMVISALSENKRRPLFRSLIDILGVLIPLSHLCGSSRGSLRFYNRRKPQIPPDKPRVSVTFRTFRACSRKKINMFNFSARILRKAVKRKETAKTVKPEGRVLTASKA